MAAIYEKTEIYYVGNGWDSEKNMSKNAVAAIADGYIPLPYLASKVAKLAGIPTADALDIVKMHGYREGWHHVGKSKKAVPFYNEKFTLCALGLAGDPEDAEEEAIASIDAARACKTVETDEYPNCRIAVTVDGFRTEDAKLLARYKGNRHLGWRIILPDGKEILRRTHPGWRSNWDFSIL